MCGGGGSRDRTMGAEAGRWPSCLSVAESGLGPRKKIGLGLRCQTPKFAHQCIGVYATI